MPDDLPEYLSANPLPPVQDASERRPRVSRVDNADGSATSVTHPARPWVALQARRNDQRATNRRKNSRSHRRPLFPPVVPGQSIE